MENSWESAETNTNKPRVKGAAVNQEGRECI